MSPYQILWRSVKPFVSNKASGHSRPNVTKRPHRRRTCSVQRYSPGGGSVHPIYYMIPWAHPCPQPKRHLHRFSHFCSAHDRASLYFRMGHPVPSKLLFPIGMWTPSNTWFLQPTQVLNRNSTSIGSAVFAGLITVSDRQIDIPHSRTVTLGRIARSTAMQSNNYKI